MQSGNKCHEAIWKYLEEKKSATVSKKSSIFDLTSLLLILYNIQSKQPLNSHELISAVQVKTQYLQI